MQHVQAHLWGLPGTRCSARTGCFGRWRRCPCRWPRTTCMKERHCGRCRAARDGAVIRRRAGQSGHPPIPPNPHCDGVPLLDDETLLSSLALPLLLLLLRLLLLLLCRRGGIDLHAGPVQGAAPGVPCHPRAMILVGSGIWQPHPCCRAGHCAARNLPGGHLHLLRVSHGSKRPRRT